MWNKSAEAKPSSQPTEVAVPVIPAPSKNELETHAAIAPESAPKLSSTYSAPLNTSTPNGTTMIATGLKVSGEISGTSDLFIDGEAQGKIRLPNARVTVGPNGRVQADIEAREIIVEGTVQGNLNAGERLHLGASSKVQGGVLTPRIGIEDGARLRGKVEMLRIGAFQIGPSVESDTDAGKAKAMSASGQDD